MYWLILLIPLLVAWCAKFFLHATITWKEMTIQMAASTALVAIVLATGLYSQTSDTEIWNGRVTAKNKVRVSCEHSYECPPCFPITDSKGNKIGESCSTCYDHSYDNDWRVSSTVDGVINISRVDRQGLITPPRWDIVIIGEPFSAEKTYTNYIQAVPESIFGKEEVVHPLAGLVPAYPRVTDYYRINRVYNGAGVKNHKLWNDGLNEIAKELGGSFQVNPIIQFVKTADPTYQFALEQKWIGGKKNDLIIVFGVSNYPKIDFVRIVSWENEKIKHKLRESLEKFTTIDENFEQYALSTIKENIVKHYKRMQMKDYEYLKDQIDPPTWVIILAFILAIISSCGITYYMHQNDVFGDEGRKAYGFKYKRFKTRH